MYVQNEPENVEGVENGKESYSEESAEQFFGEQNTDTNDNTIEADPQQDEFQPQHHDDDNDENNSQMNPNEFEPAIMPTFRESMNHSEQQQQNESVNALLANFISTNLDETFIQKISDCSTTNR